MLTRPNDPNDKEAGHSNIATQILQSPIQFHENADTLVALAASNQLNPRARLTINPQETLANATADTTQNIAAQSLLTPVRDFSSTSRTPSSGPRPPGSGSNDVRVLHGRIPNGGIGLGSGPAGSPAQFAQLAKLGLPSPVTPLIPGRVGTSANGSENAGVDGKSRSRTHLFVDGWVPLPPLIRIWLTSPSFQSSARY